MVGNKDIISAVRKIKTVFDVGQFVPIQHAASVALDLNNELEEAVQGYKTKSNKIYTVLKNHGFDVIQPQSAFFIWGKVPVRYKNNSSKYIKELWEETSVLLMPGIGYGSNGENHFRISLTPDMQTIEEAITRMVAFETKKSSFYKSTIV